jgi:hypothetical protein
VSARRPFTTCPGTPARAQSGVFKDDVHAHLARRETTSDYRGRAYNLAIWQAWLTAKLGASFKTAKITPGLVELALEEWKRETIIRTGRARLSGLRRTLRIRTSGRNHMNRLRRIAAILLVAACVAGCGTPRVDGTNVDSLNKSLKQLRNSVPTAQREEFDNAVLAIVMKYTRSGGVEPRDVLNGKSATDILTMAKELEAVRQKEHRERDQKEVAELEKEKAAAETARTELARFEVLRSKFSTSRNAIGMSEPRIELRIKNGTSQAISRAFFHGKVVSPGRPVPWISEDFNYAIPGGLNPGAEVTWNLTPNSFGPRAASTPQDAGLEVTVVRLDGADGQPLFNTDRFTSLDAARLAVLKRQLAAK